MRNRSKILLSALAAALVLAAAIGTAQARRIELSNTNIRAVWTAAEPLVFETSLANISCSVTLEGSFHSRTLSKVSGQLVGLITRAAVARPCNVGEAWVLNGVERLSNGTTTMNSLPWHVRYDSFTGTLPRIEKIRLQLIGASFLIAFAGQGCLVRTEAAHPAFGFVEVEVLGGVTGLRADETVSIPPNVKLEGLLNCPNGRFVGRAAVTLLGNTTRITVRLVQ